MRRRHVEGNERGEKTKTKTAHKQDSFEARSSLHLHNCAWRCRNILRVPRHTGGHFPSREEQAAHKSSERPNVISHDPRDNMITLRYILEVPTHHLSLMIDISAKVILDGFETKHVTW